MRKVLQLVLTKKNHGKRSRKFVTGGEPPIFQATCETGDSLVLDFFALRLNSFFNS